MCTEGGNLPVSFIQQQLMLARVMLHHSDWIWGHPLWDTIFLSLIGASLVFRISTQIPTSSVFLFELWPRGWHKVWNLRPFPVYHLLPISPVPSPQPMHFDGHTSVWFMCHRDSSIHVKFDTFVSQSLLYFCWKAWRWVISTYSHQVVFASCTMSSFHAALKH